MLRDVGDHDRGCRDMGVRSHDSEVEWRRLRWGQPFGLDSASARRLRNGNRILVTLRITVQQEAVHRNRPVWTESPLVELDIRRTEIRLFALLR